MGEKVVQKSFFLDRKFAGARVVGPVVEGRGKGAGNVESGESLEKKFRCG